MSLHCHTDVELSVSMDQLLPAIRRFGATIMTPDGRSLTMLPGSAADRLADLIGEHLGVELVRREARHAAGDARFLGGRA